MTKMCAVVDYFPSMAVSVVTDSEGATTEIIDYNLDLRAKRIKELVYVAEDDTSFIPVPLELQDLVMTYSAQAEAEPGLTEWWTLDEKSSTLVPPSLSWVKSKVKAKLADIRYHAETSAIEVNGSLIANDRDSQAKIHEAAYGFSRGLQKSIQFKTADGSFITLDSQGFDEVARAVFQHVQACFHKEAELSGLLDAATDLETVLALKQTLREPEGGWPVSVNLLRARPVV